MFGRMLSDGRIASMEISLLDPHGGDLGGFFMVGGSADQCAALTNDEEFRRASIDANLIVENFGVVPAAPTTAAELDTAGRFGATDRLVRGRGSDTTAVAAHRDSAVQSWRAVPERHDERDGTAP